MNRLTRDLIILIIACAILWTFAPQLFSVNVPLGSGKAPTEKALHEHLILQKGFKISIYATGLPGARILRLTETGDLLVSLPEEGNIVLLQRNDDPNNGPSGRKNLVTELDRPHGIDIFDGWLYVAETGAIGRIRFDEKTGKTQGSFQRIVSNLPAGGNHWSRTLRFGPDGLMYLTIGSTCNVCIEKDPRRSSMMRFQPDGSDPEIYATGLRNTVGFDWRPDSKELYGVENGRDYLGDDFPPEELNRIVEGGFYGWPYANGDKVADPDLGVGNEEKIQQSIPPVFSFDAHSAPLGIRFLRSKSLPDEWRGKALVALHGSWNRSQKSGYKVLALSFTGDPRISEHYFIDGFEQNNNVIGRPVDIVEAADGSIYISDDYSGVVYRVVYDPS